MLLIIVVQALKSKEFNNFTAIYFLLLDRWQKCTRLFSMHTEHRLADDRRRPSTVAEQAVVQFAIGNHPPALSDTRAGPFSRTTDGVTPVDLNAPLRATQQQRIYTSGAHPSVTERGRFASGQRPSLAGMSIDEGVELEDNENSYEMLNQSQAAAAASASDANMNLVSFSLSDGSSDVASFDSTTDADSVVQSTAWAFTSGDSVSSAPGLACPSSAATSQDFPTDNSANVQESPLGSRAVRNLPRRTSVTGRCYLAVPGPTNTLQVPVVGVQGGSQDGFFHSGRRASDGLATHADILKLQQQQLMKTHGVAELQKELDSLPIPVDPRQLEELTSWRTELGPGRPQHQHSFEDGSYRTVGRLSPSSVRRSRQGVTGNSVRPRLAALSRNRQPVPSRSPLEELTTLCGMLPTGATVEHNRSPVNSEHQLLQQHFQQLGIEPASNYQPVPILPSSAGLIQLPIAIGQTAIAACLSDQGLAAPSQLSTLADVSACHSHDSIHSYTMTESFAPAHLPVGQPVPAADDASTGSVRRHMVRRTLYRLAHQQTLISSFGEEDIPEVSPVSEQAAGTTSDYYRPPESKPSDNMDET